MEFNSKNIDDKVREGELCNGQSRVVYEPAQNTEQEVYLPVLKGVPYTPENGKTEETYKGEVKNKLIKGE